jgi:hypothetical protein
VAFLSPHVEFDLKHTMGLQISFGVFCDGEIERYPEVHIAWNGGIFMK